MGYSRHRLPVMSHLKIDGQTPERAQYPLIEERIISVSGLTSEPLLKVKLLAFFSLLIIVHIETPKVKVLRANQKNAMLNHTTKPPIPQCCDLAEVELLSSGKIPLPTPCPTQPPPPPQPQTQTLHP